MQTSGVILDFYDDSRGEQLRELYATREEIPAIVKAAHVLSPEERQALPDEDFALVLLNEGEKLRKYACIDRGNTTLSIDYFLNNAQKLPAEAQKTAARNLVTACAWYGITPPETLEKIAFLGFLANRVKSNPLGALQTAMTAPSVVQGVGNEVRARNEIARSAGGAVVTPEQMSHALGRGKMAEASLTSVMPGPKADKTVAPSKAVINKTAAGMPHLLPECKHGPDDSPPPAFHKEAPPALPQMRVLKPHVDVTGREPPTHTAEKKASVYALGERYPLDNYEQVLTAVQYFNDYGRRFVPADRHEYCSNLVKRADAVGISIPDAIRRYGSHELAGTDEIKMAFDQRRLLVNDPAERELIDAIEKIAFQVKRGDTIGMEELDHNMVIGALDAFDKKAGLEFYYDRDLMDPYFSLLGFEKDATADFTFNSGNDYVTGTDLMQLARTNADQIAKMFGDDLSNEFRKDPVGIFKSLPLVQKKVLMRMSGEPTSSTQGI